jgi:hypothetical protein
VSPVELALPLRHSRELLGREINPTVYTQAEINKKRSSKDPFLLPVLEEPKLFVPGKADELGKAAS